MRHGRSLALTLALAGSLTARAHAAPAAVAARFTTVLVRSPRLDPLLAWKLRAWTPPAANPGGGVPAAGLRLAIDPVDGARDAGGPAGDAERALLARAPVAVTLRANGSGRAQLDDRFADFAVVSLDPRGRPVWTCVHGPWSAQRFVRGAAPPCPEVPMEAAAPEVEK